MGDHTILAGNDERDLVVTCKRLLRRSGWQVMTVLSMPMPRVMAKRILVPLKSTEPAASFVEALAGLARGTGATVRLLHVGPLTGAAAHGSS